MYYIFVVCFIASLICVWSFSQCSHIYYSGIKSKTCSSCQTSNLHSLQFFSTFGSFCRQLLLVSHFLLMDLERHIVNFLVYSSYNFYCCFDPFPRFWATGPESFSVIRSQQLFQRASGNWGKAHLTPSGRVHKSSFHWGGKTVDTLCRGVNHALHMCPLFSTEVIV